MEKYLIQGRTNSTQHVTIDKEFSSELSLKRYCGRELKQKGKSMNATVHKCEWLVGKVCAKIETLEIKLSKKDRLKRLQEIVGGYIEIVHWKGKDLVINEEGLLLGLPINQWALAQGLNLVGNIVEIDGLLD